MRSSPRKTSSRPPLKNNVTCAYFPVPALVAVHRVIAPGDRGNTDIAMPGDILLELPQIADRRLRWGVAAVEKGVHGDRNTGLGDNAGEGGDLLLVRMHPARRHQPH